MSRAAVDVMNAMGTVVGVDPDAMRSDTPLDAIGWDSLATICLEDSLASAGLAVIPERVRASRTVGDLIDSVVPVAGAEGTA
jgi:hypothetical protein